MRKRRNYLGRKKIIVYFLLVIALPSLILGALAFRGIQNDQALLERENRIGASEEGQLIISTMRNQLLLIESEFTVLTEEVEKPTEAFFTDSLLETFIVNQPLVNSIGFYQDPSQFQLLRSGLQFVTDGAKGDQNERSGEPSEVWEEGWRLEFQVKDLNGALDYYQDNVKSVSTRYQRAIASNAISRIQKKLNQPAKAIQSYHRIGREYPHVFLRGMPIALVANLEISKLSLEMGLQEESTKAIEQAVTDLTNRRWLVEERPYRFLISMVEEQIDKIAPPPRPDSIKAINGLRDLSALEKERREITEAILLLQGSRSDVLGRNQINDLTGETIRFSEDLNDREILLSIIPKAATEIWCLFFDAEKLMSHFSQTLIDSNGRRSKWYWLLRDNKNRIKTPVREVPQDAQFVEIGLPADLPAWSILAYQKQLTLWQRFSRSGQGIYFYIFLFIIAVLVFGSIFTLQTMNNQLLLSKLKSDFISTVSHEFKNPLTSIRQMSEMLQTGRVRNEERKKIYYDNIVHQSERLSHMIDNVLDFSRLEEGRKVFHFEAVDFGVLLSNMIDDFESSHERDNLRIIRQFENDLPETIADPDGLQQVIDNLLGNALKYAGEKKEIIVRVSLGENEIIVDIKDLGLGISMEDQRKIFDRFYRASDIMTLGIEGSGIGLTVVKQIIQAHGGEISVKSQLGEGSTFTFTLPTN